MDTLQSWALATLLPLEATVGNFGIDATFRILREHRYHAYGLQEKGRNVVVCHVTGGIGLGAPCNL